MGRSASDSFEIVLWLRISAHPQLIQGYVYQYLLYPQSYSYLPSHCHSHITLRYFCLISHLYLGPKDSFLEEDAKKHGQFPNSLLGFLSAMMEIRAKNQAAAF